MAGDKIEKLATKMDDSSGNLNQELSSSIQAISKVLMEIKLSTASNAQANSEAMNAGAENFLKIMSENLEAIRLNTAQGASAISDAAEKMNEAADTFKNQLAKATEDSSNTVRNQMNAAGENASSAISEAGSKLLETFGSTAGTITEHANSLSATLLEPLKEFQDNLSKLGKEISASGTEFGRLGENIKLGAVSTEKAARSFENSATEFSKVVAPINLSIEKISQSINSLENSTDQANRSLTKGISTLIASSEQAFEAAVEIIRGEQAALENSLQGMQDMIEAFKGQGDRLDDMDEKLGVAFEQYAEHVESQLDQMKQHARDLTEKLSPALDKMREVVEHAEQFIPESRVNRR
jgi:methyl-accepting chemotaxis protein